MYKKNKDSYISLHINAVLMPLDRGFYFEEPIDYTLKKLGIGEVVGGSTCLNRQGEIVGCDIDIVLKQSTDENLEELQSFVSFLGVPKGSHIVMDGKEIVLGDLECLVLYLNGTELADEIYEKCDVNFLISEITRVLDSNFKFYSYWQGPQETALYFYGNSFEQMKKLITPFVQRYPLCQGSRIVKQV